AGGLQGTSTSTHPREHSEKEQPPAKPSPRSPHPSTTSAQGAAGEKARSEVCPPGYLGIPAGRAALLRQEAIACREDSGLPVGEESPAEALGKGSSQPEPLGPGGSQGTEGAPGRGRSEEGAMDAEGKAGSGLGEVCPGKSREDSSPGEQSEGRAPGKGGSKEDSQLEIPREEPGMEKPPAKRPELPKVEQVGTAEGRRAEVCPLETREQGRTARAEICPWDTEGAQPERERQEGKSIRPKSLGGSPKSGGAAEQAGMGLPAKHPAVPKPSSQQAGTTGSKKATVCPWEVEDEPLPKAQICPWEEVAAPAGKGGLSQDMRGASRGEVKPGSRGLEDSEAKLAETGRDSGIFAK
ncbi:GP179 protein, partial [Scytalopus superciliaris]|nr:GP179 protein [Scytalopus superciliaris]